MLYFSVHVKKMASFLCSFLPYSIQKQANPEQEITQPTITCSKLTIEALEQGVKYAAS